MADQELATALENLTIGDSVITGAAKPGSMISGLGSIVSNNNQRTVTGILQEVITKADNTKRYVVKVPGMAHDDASSNIHLEAGRNLVKTTLMMGWCTAILNEEDITAVDAHQKDDFNTEYQEMRITVAENATAMTVGSNFKEIRKAVKFGANAGNKNPFTNTSAVQAIKRTAGEIGDAQQDGADGGNADEAEDDGESNYTGGRSAGPVLGKRMKKEGSQMGGPLLLNSKMQGEQGMQHYNKIQIINSHTNEFFGHGEVQFFFDKTELDQLTLLWQETPAASFLGDVHGNAKAQAMKTSMTKYLPLFTGPQGAAMGPLIVPILMADYAIRSENIIVLTALEDHNTPEARERAAKNGKYEDALATFHKEASAIIKAKVIEDPAKLDDIQETSVTGHAAIKLHELLQELPAKIRKVAEDIEEKLHRRVTAQATKQLLSGTAPGRSTVGGNANLPGGRRTVQDNRTVRTHWLDAAGGMVPEEPSRASTVGQFFKGWSHAQLTMMMANPPIPNFTATGAGLSVAEVLEGLQFVANNRGRGPGGRGRGGGRHW